MKTKILNIFKSTFNVISIISVILLIIILSIALILYLANGYTEQNENIIALIWALTAFNSILTATKNFKIEKETKESKLLEEIKQELKVIKRKI